MTPALRPTLLDRPLPGDAATLPRRKAALAALEAAGWPTPKRERWRYTNLVALGNADLDPAPAAPSAADLAAAEALLASLGKIPADRRIVLIDGHYAPTLSRLTVAGIELVTGTPPTEMPETTAADHPLAAVNAAFRPGTLRIRVQARVAVTDPVHLVLLASGRQGVASQPHVLIEAGEGSSVAIAQHLAAAEGANGWLNAVTQVVAARGARIELHRLQRGEREITQTSLLAAELDTDAELRAGYFDLGGRPMRNDIDVKLAKRGARAELFGLLLVPTGHHVDDHVSVEHAAPDTQSEQAFRAIVGRRGRAVFNGRVVVRPNAQRIDARQTSDNLLLGEHAEIDAKPELEIYADDVKCSHGTTVGELDAEQLFFLRSRGLGEVDARELLTRAFADTIVERVRSPGVRETIAAAVGAALAALAEQSR